VISLVTGEIVEWLADRRPVRELFEVIALPESAAEGDRADQRRDRALTRSTPSPSAS